MRKVSLYIEGGGSSRNTMRPLRTGFSKFLRNAGIDSRKIQIKVCGDRDETHKRFVRACEDGGADYKMLLVDSEGPVNSTPKQHLRNRDGWKVNESEDQYHLMVQAMEAWLIADRTALIQYYGKEDFQESALPDTQDVEQIDKDKLKDVLRQASRNTQKGPYHEIRHGAKLLERIDANTVLSRARHCERLFLTLTNKIEEN